MAAAVQLLQEAGSTPEVTVAATHGVLAADADETLARLLDDLEAFH